MQRPVTIIADTSVWVAALDGRLGRGQAVFHALRQQRRITAPGLIFAGLLAELDDPARAEMARVWATEAPPLPDSTMAGSTTLWISAGDLGARLRRAGVMLDDAAHCLIAVCVREAAPLWSLDPVFDAVAEHLPLERFTVPLD